MSEIKKQHDSFLKEHSARMAKLREPLHKVATSHSKGKTLQKLKQPRMLTAEESRQKTKNWPKSGQDESMKAQMSRHGENKAFQRKTGRAWND